MESGVVGSLGGKREGVHQTFVTLCVVRMEMVDKGKFLQIWRKLCGLNVTLLTRLGRDIIHRCTKIANEKAVKSQDSGTLAKIRLHQDTKSNKSSTYFLLIVRIWYTIFTCRIIELFSQLSKYDWQTQAYTHWSGLNFINLYWLGRI